MMESHGNDASAMLLHVLSCGAQSYFLLSVIVFLYESFKDANELIQTVIIASMDS